MILYIYQYYTLRHWTFVREFRYLVREQFHLRMVQFRSKHFGSNFSGPYRVFNKPCVQHRPWCCSVAQQDNTNSCTVGMLTALLTLHCLVVTFLTDLVHAKCCKVCFLTILTSFLSVVCFLLGNYPASGFYMPTFRNTVSSIFIGR